MHVYERKHRQTNEPGVSVHHASRRTSALACAGAGGSLLLAGACPASSWSQLRAPGAAGTATGPVVAALSLGGWALVLWLAVTVALTASSRLPGLVGLVSAVAARHVAPTAVRRGVELALGLGLAAGAAGAAPAAAAAPAAGTAVSAVVVADAPARGLGGPRSSTTPATCAAAPAPAARLDWPARGAGGAVVVQAGDTLWALAERGLRDAGVTTPSDSQVAHAWPRWWAANREAVGADPHRIVPGTALSPP